ncbi:MAG: arginine deiminase family protein [Bacteroidota bacterium]
MKEWIEDQEINFVIVDVIPSSELSRARGGSHCMTCPVERVSL